MQRIGFLCLALMLPLLLVSCKDGALIEDPATIVAMQKEMEQAGFDLSQVAVARAHIGDRSIEITSLTPVVIGTGKFALPDGRISHDAKTIFRFADKRDVLVLFTRDGANKRAYRVAVPVSDISAKRTVRFPVVGIDGQIAEKDIAFDSLIVK